MAFGFANHSAMPALSQRLQSLQQAGQQLSQPYPAWSGIPGSQAGGTPQAGGMSLPDAWGAVKSAASKVGIGGSPAAPQSSPYDGVVNVGNAQLGGSMPDAVNLPGWGSYSQAMPEATAAAAPATVGTGGSIAHYLAALFGG